MTRYLKSLVLSILLMAGFASSALALSNEEVFSQFQFNFLTPGARATGLGGAFIGLADDATAVESNPAGLTQLYDPEVSFEGKYIAYTTKQIYENFSENSDITKRDFINSVKSPAFASVAFPYKRVVFALYRQELLNYQSSYQTSQYPIVIPSFNGAFFPIKAATDLSVTNYGFGIAVQPFEGFSFAVSPRWSEMKMTSSSERFDADPDNQNPYLVPTDFSEGQIRNKSWIDDRDGQFSVNAGLLWRLQFIEKKLNIPKVSFGAVYRSGPKFTVRESFSYGLLPVYAIAGVVITDTATLANNAEFTVKVPDSFGAGFAVQPTKDLTFTLDVVHIKYQDLLENFNMILLPAAAKDNYTIDNATEVHLGAEYVLTLGEKLLALRLGGYYEPDHTIRFTGTTAGKAADPAYSDAVQKALFPGGDAQFHVTGGVGLVVNEHFQLDTAANVADKNKQFSVSAVYRF